ncbi:hypothetical protein RRG08_022375 [Elysia crispata]|uniref:Uncharacterized protein n=1 Tax=Elysia crispata TaxID=231223 RepID=A0AAE0Z198_9GAST|nr:hypothetical protein RRG08_022375 [Elysia crispata]
MIPARLTTSDQQGKLPGSCINHTDDDLSWSRNGSASALICVPSKSCLESWTSLNTGQISGPCRVSLSLPQSLSPGEGVELEHVNYK